MKILKILLIFVVILSFCTEASALGGKRNRGKINAKKVKVAMDEPSLDLTTIPFSNVIDWRYEENRKDYKDLLKKAGYTIEAHEIRYTNNNGEKIENIWYEKELFEVIKRRGNVIGFIWTTQNTTLPSLIYKLVDDKKFYEPQLIYSKVYRYEIIQQNKLVTSLSDYELVSFKWIKKKLAKTNYKASIKREGLPRNYLRTDSLKKFLDYAEKHYQKILELQKTKKLEKTIWVVFLKENEEKYREIQQMIKNDVEKHGDDDWEDKWEDIQAKWPSMRGVK